jgi:hypothetical protein
MAGQSTFHSTRVWLGKSERESFAVAATEPE